MLAALFLPRTVHSAAVDRIWLVAAVASIATAVAVASQPGFLLDLSLIRTWLAAFAQGGNPYQLFNDVDYPPNALILLYPLHWLPDSMPLWLYAPMAVAATATATWWTAGWLAERLGVHLSNRDRAILVAMMLAGSSLRGAIWRGQPAPFAFLFGAAALHWSERRPLLAALALACCAFKPHVAIGFALAIFVTTGLPVLLGAGAGVLAMNWWFAIETGQTLAATWRDYASQLARLYVIDGPDRVRGMLSIRWVVEDLVGDYDAGSLVYLAVAACTAALILDAGLRRSDARSRTLAAVALMLWSLLFLPHQLYHGWMAAPALWLMMWPEAGLIANGRLRLYTVSLFVAFGVVDVPRLMRIVMDPDLHDTLGWISYALSPLRMAMLFGLLLLVIGRGLRTPVLRA